MSARTERRPVGRRRIVPGQRLFWSCVAVALFVSALGLFHTWTRVASLERSYQLSRSKAELENLNDEKARLELELATLRSKFRLDQEARERLRMGPPPPSRVVVLPKQPVSVKEALAQNER